MGAAENGAEDRPAEPSFLSQICLSYTTDSQHLDHPGQPQARQISSEEPPKKIGGKAQEGKVETQIQVAI